MENKTNEIEEHNLKARVEIALKALNTMIEQCKEKNVSIAIGVTYPEKNMEDTIYLHKSNTTKFYLKEIYGK